MDGWKVSKWKMVDASKSDSFIITYSSKSQIPKLRNSKTMKISTILSDLSLYNAMLSKVEFVSFFYVLVDLNLFTSSNIISISHKIHIITHCSELFVVFIIIFFCFFGIKLNCLVFKWFSIETLAIQHSLVVVFRSICRFSHCFHFFEYLTLYRMEPNEIDRQTILSWVLATQFWAITKLMFESWLNVYSIEGLLSSKSFSFCL